jgi:hypothetical protein
MRAPPPIPVSPTVKPTMSPASATDRSMCTGGSLPGVEYVY